jgi:hypothetical protein
MGYCSRAVSKGCGTKSKSLLCFAFDLLCVLLCTRSWLVSRWMMVNGRGVVYGREQCCFLNETLVDESKALTNVQFTARITCVTLVRPQLLGFLCSSRYPFIQIPV